MNAHTPEHPPPESSALAEIERERGKLYDATVVDACLRLFRERQFQLPDRHPLP